MSNRATSVNPRVLRWARERSGLSLAAVAESLGKSPEVIEEWETAGGKTPTFRQLEQLAQRLYKRPVAIFFFPDPPDEADPRSQFRTLPTSELDMFSPDTRYALREALAFQESIREFTGNNNPAPDFITRTIRATLDTSVEGLAVRVRSYLDISLETQSSWSNPEAAFKQWRRIIEQSGIFVFKRPFKQGDIFGFCVHDDTIPLIVINNSATYSRQIFTLFHELAHLLYSVSGITKEDMSYVDELVGRPYHIEVACNRFAAEFLVPSSTFPWDAVPHANLEQFVLTQARRYNVSREVILRRLFDRGLVDQDTYLKNTEKWNLEYQQSRQRRSGGNYYATQATYLGEAFLRLAFSQYYRGRLSLEQLASHLRVKARNLARLEDFVITGG